ncbi:GspE/PulE family protein [Clostridium sp.]|uniref:GspE/PulE family protein n=1 Tax=Clostridium sp. TaxID=1506 RepID=UPI00261392DD|nr:GspE/PulE family protein [Clostridium sp.]
MDFSIRDVDMSIMSIIPNKAALINNVIAIKDKGNDVCFYTDYEDENKKNYLSVFLPGRKISFIIGEKHKVKNLIDACYNKKNLSEDEFTEEEFNNLVSLGIKKNASDIHIEPVDGAANIRLRIDGILNIEKVLKQQLYENLINKIKIKSDMNIGDKLRAQDGKMSFKNEGYECDLRISILPTIWGEKVVIRILYKKNNLITIDNLNLMNEQYEKILRVLKLRHGMVVVNGPTGSGKSTTLYALINSINKEGINISTIEDPVEFSIKGITQTNVNEKMGLTFANGLKHILRQDPDVILIGEIRDEDTAKIAIRSSITGHKVYSTIHANSGKEVYDRLLDMGAEKYLVKEGLSAIITQRLVRKNCENCKKKIPCEEYGYENKKKNFYLKGVGCEKCNWSGKKGRKAVCEIIFPKEYKNKEEIPWGKELLKSCLNLVYGGEVSLDEYYLLKECEGLDDFY